MHNEGAKAVINAYLQEVEPGYALLIDAPWGSGKTYTVKKLTNCDYYKDRLYVTLYDVDSPESFDWAIVRAVNPWVEGRNSNIIKQIRKFSSGLQLFGFSVDLSKINMSEIVMQNLPNTIIFDDIERCSLSHRQLSGLINRFVEHKKKSVILISNTEKHPDKETFDSSREKLIGQTITLMPDSNSAISACWGRVNEGIGRSSLESRQELILKVFQEAGHQNLRLLLRSVRDAAIMLNSLPPEFFEFEQAIDRLIMTFLALHMAYHGGELSKDDMLNRARIRIGNLLQNENDEERPADVLEIVQKRHPKSNINLGYSDVLPLDIAYALIVDGYAAPEAVLESLKSTHQFSAPSQKPDWVRLWEWDNEPIHEFENLINRLEKREENLEIIEPGEILQLHGARNFIAKFLLTEDKKLQARRTFDYVCRLSGAGKIRPSIPSSTRGGRYGFSMDMGRFSFGGYAYEPDRRERFIARRLMEEMDKSFERKIGERSYLLLEELRSSPEEFMERFDCNMCNEDYSETPILHRLPAYEFARILLDHYEKDRGAARAVAKKLSQRRQPHRAELSDEIPWFSDVEQQLVDQASVKSVLLAGQIRLFIRRHLSARN